MQGDLHFFDKKFAYVKKKQYFCTLFRKVLSTRISVLHRILVPRSEVRLLGGQQKAALAAFIVISYQPSAIRKNLNTEN